MKPTLQPGVAAQLRRRVVSEDLVSFVLKGMPAVLSSPRVLLWMELAAEEALRPHLEAGELSLGVKFEFEHLAPTPCGQVVVASARVVSVEDRRVTLEIEARDEQQLIARGTHVRAVVNRERFDQRLRRLRS